jgi:hypothetical protein
LRFSTFNRNVLRDIAFLVVEHCETSFRESLQRQYDWKVSEREEALKQVRLAAEREKQRKAAELQALRDRRQTLMDAAVHAIAWSDRIRELVSAFEERFERDKLDNPAFLNWRRWALMEADAIDPRMRSEDESFQWFGKFELSPPIDVTR